MSSVFRRFLHILLLFLIYVKASSSQSSPPTWSWPTEYKTLSRPVEVKCLKEIMKHDKKIGDDNFLHVAGSHQEIHEIINNIYINEDTDITLAFYTFNDKGLHYFGTFKTKRELLMNQLMKYENYVLRNFHHLYDDKGRIWMINKLIVIPKGMRDLSIFFKDINDKFILGDHNNDLDLHSGDTKVDVGDIDQPAGKEKVPFATDYKVYNNFDKNCNIFNSFGNGEIHGDEKVNDATNTQYIPYKQLVNPNARLNKIPYIEHDIKIHRNLPRFQPLLNVLNTKPYYENPILNKVTPEYDIIGRNIPSKNYQWNIPYLANKNVFYMPNHNVEEVKRLNVHDSEYEPVSFGDIKILNSKLNKPLPVECIKNANGNYKYRSFTPRYIEIKPSLFDANSSNYYYYRPTFYYNLESTEAIKLYKVKTPVTYIQNNQPYAFYQPTTPMVYVRNNDVTNNKDITNEPLQYDSQIYQTAVPDSVKTPISKSNINTQPSRFATIKFPNFGNYQYMTKKMNDLKPLQPNFSEELSNERIMSIYNGVEEIAPIQHENFEETLKIDKGKHFACMMPNYEQADLKKHLYEIPKDKYEICQEPNNVNVGSRRAQFFNWPFNGQSLLSPHIKDYDAQMLDNQRSMPININKVMHNSEENILKEAPFQLHDISQLDGNNDQFSAEIPNFNYIQESNTDKNKNSRLVGLYNQHPFQWQNALYGPSYSSPSYVYQIQRNGYLPNNVPVSLKKHLISEYPKDKYALENNSDGAIQSIPNPIKDGYLTQVNPYADALKLKPSDVENVESVTPINYHNYFKNDDMYAKESELKKMTNIHDLYKLYYNTLNVEAFNLNQENNFVNVLNKPNSAKQKPNNYNSYGGNKYAYNINQNLSPVLTELITKNNPHSEAYPNVIKENMPLRSHLIKLPASIEFLDKADAKKANLFNYYQKTTEMDKGTKYNEVTGDHEQMIENDVPDSYLTRKYPPNHEIINVKEGSPSVGNTHPYYVHQLAYGDNMYNKIPDNMIDSNIHKLQPGITKAMNINTVRQMQALPEAIETLPENLIMKVIEPNVSKVINDKPYPILEENKMNNDDTSVPVAFAQILDVQQTDGAPVNSIISNIPVNYEQAPNLLNAESLLNPNYLNDILTIPKCNGILNRNIPQCYQMQYPLTNAVNYDTRIPLNIAYYKSINEPENYDPKSSVYDLNVNVDKSVPFKDGIKDFLPYKTQIHRTVNALQVAPELYKARAPIVAEQPCLGLNVATNYVTPMETFRNPDIPIAGLYDINDYLKSNSKSEYDLLSNSIDETNYYEIDKTDSPKDYYKNKGKMNEVEYNPYNVKNSIINKDESAKDFINLWKPNLEACAGINNDRSSKNIDIKGDPAIASYFCKPNNIDQTAQKVNGADNLNNIPLSYITGDVPSKETDDLQHLLINPSDKLPNNNYWYTNNEIDNTKFLNARFQSENHKTSFKESPEPLSNGQFIFDNNNKLENPYYYTTEHKTKFLKSVLTITPNKESYNTIKIDSAILDNNNAAKTQLKGNGQLNSISPNAYQFGETTVEATTKPVIYEEFRPVSPFAEKVTHSQTNINEAENENNDIGSVLKPINYGTYLPKPNNNIPYIKNEDKIPILNNYYKILGTRISNNIQETQNIPDYTYRTFLRPTEPNINKSENIKSLPYIFWNIYEKSKEQLNKIGNTPEAKFYLGEFLSNNPETYKVNNINLNPMNVVDDVAAKSNIQDIPTAYSLISTNPFHFDMPNNDNDLCKFTTHSNNEDSKQQFNGLYVPDDNYTVPWKTLPQDAKIKTVFPYLESNGLYSESRPIATQFKKDESFKFEVPKQSIKHNILSKFINPLVKVAINKDFEPVKYNGIEFIDNKKLNDIKNTDNNESPFKFNDAIVNPVNFNNNTPLQSAVPPPKTFDAFNILRSNTNELETEPRFYPYFNNQVSQTDSSNAYNTQNLQLAKSNSNIPSSFVSLPTVASSKMIHYPLSRNAMSSPYRSADLTKIKTPTLPSEYNYQYLASPNSFSSSKSSNALNPYATLLSSDERSNSPSAFSTPSTINTSTVTETSDLLNNIDTNDSLYNLNNYPEITLPIASFGVAEYNPKENEKYLNAKTNTLNPFKCLPSIERSKSQNGILTPPITNLSTDTKLTNDLLNYSRRDDIKQNLYNNPAIAIPLGSFDVAIYDPNDIEKIFNVETDNNDIDLKAWYSVLKTIKAKLTFEVEETEVLNFLPIAKNKSKYTPKQIQDISKDAIRKKYGEPIEIKGVYSLNNPYALVNNIDHTFNNRRLVLWPTFCGCQKAGCECYWHRVPNRYNTANL